MYMYMYTHIYLSLHIYIYRERDTHTYMYTHVYAYINNYIFHILEVRGREDRGAAGVAAMHLRGPQRERPHPQQSYTVN